MNYAFTLIHSFSLRHLALIIARSLFLQTFIAHPTPTKLLQTINPDQSLSNKQENKSVSFVPAHFLKIAHPEIFHDYRKRRKYDFERIATKPDKSDLKMAQQQELDIGNSLIYNI